MRKLFGELITQAMEHDPRIWLLTGDLGFGVLDPVRQSYPNRFCNVGAAEQLMMGAAVGLAHNGCRPLVYSITPFAIFRPYEYIRNYLDHERACVKIVGAGRDHDYGNNGFSHWAHDDRRALGVFDNVSGWWPQDEDELVSQFAQWLAAPGPAYLNLKR